MALSAKMRLGASGALLLVGTGVPGLVAPKGSIYLKSDGTDAVLYENRGGTGVWTIPGGSGGGGSPTPIASSTTSGTVKTNTDNADPVVYRKSEVDAAFAPTTHTHAASDLVSGVLAIGRIPTGTTGSTVALGNDARFSDARTPIAHAASHAAAGSDPITPAAIGASATGHVHAAADVTSGTFAIARIPTGTSGSTVALGNHTHAASEITSGFLPTSRGGTAADGSSLPANQFLASSTAASGSAVTYRAIDPLDIPALAASKITSGTFGVAQLGTGTPAAGKYVDGGTGAWTALPASAGAATAAALGLVKISGTPTDPANPVVYAKEQSDLLLNGKAAVSHTHFASEITGGLLPTTRGGTAADGSSLPANQFLASSSAAGGSAVTYRAIDPLDIPALPESKITNLVTDLAAKAPIAITGKATADQAVIGTTATTVTGLTLALAASTRYRFRIFIVYVCTVATATLAARVKYSGTLGATTQSTFKVRGSSGAPNVWAAAYRENTQAINSAIATATGGPGASGTASLLCVLEITGEILTNAAGNLDAEIVGSAASSITPKAGSVSEAVIVP